jgi:dipeptidyl aminopeptidase/acylaminoacyl peptidase
MRPCVISRAVLTAVLLGAWGTPGFNPASAALPDLIPREVLFGNPERTMPRLSPDGKLLAYLAPHEGVMNVWVRTVGRQDDRAVTRDRKRGIRFYQWQYDSRHILYFQDLDGDENFHVYQTRLEGEITRDLTPFQGIRAQEFFLDQKYPEQALVGLNLRDRRLFDIHRLDLRTGAVELDTQNPGDVSGWTTDNSFRVRIAQVTTPDGGTEIRQRDGPQSPWRTLLKWGPDESFGGVPGFAPDNKSVYVISSVEANTSRLLRLAPGGKPEVLAEDRQFDLGGWMRHPATRRLEAVRFIRERSEWQVLDPSVEADFEALAKVRDGDFSVVSRDLADKAWLVSYMVDDGPVVFYTFDRASRKATLLFTERPVLEKYQLAKMRPVSFSARDGMKLFGYLTLPVGVEPKTSPMVLLVHGGPWGRDVWGNNSLVQWLANRGYGVLQVNFRGSAGYGKDYLNAGDKEWGAKMHDDLIDAKRWALQNGYADPRKVAIMGGSYGGYATLAGLAFTPEEFACGVDIVGPSNLVTLLSTIPPYWVPMKAMFTKRVGSLETEEDFLRSRSPLFKASQITKPLLIGQGANDPRVKQAESDQIVKAMRDNGKPVEYLVFPDEGHGFARPENRLRFYAAAEAFLARYLGGRAEPPSAAESVEAFRR